MSTHDRDDLRDPRLDAAWRAASNEEPPAALDDAIRAAARRDVSAGPQRSAASVTSVPQALRPERWWMPLAAAATIGAIAVGILQLSSPEKMIEPAHDKVVVTDMPSTPKSTTETAPVSAPSSPAAGNDTRNRVAPAAPATAPAPPENGSPTLRKDSTPGTANEEPLKKQKAGAPAPSLGSGAREAGALEAAKPAAPMAEPFPGDVKREAKEKAAGASSSPLESPAGGLTAKVEAAPRPSARDEITREPERANAPMAQSSAPAAQTPMRRLQGADAARAPAPLVGANAAAGDNAEARSKTQPKLPVTDWIALIRKLRDEGKTDDAAKELAAFRSAYPDHEQLLPPDLRDWKPVTQ